MEGRVKNPTREGDVWGTRRVRNPKRLLAGGGGVGGVGGVVAVAGAGYQLAMAAGRDDVYVDAAEATVLGGVRRIVAQSVLMANVVSYLFADGVHVFHIFREESESAGG